MIPITSTKASRYEQTEKGITVSPIEETILSEYSLSVFIVPKTKKGIKHK